MRMPAILRNLIAALSEIFFPRGAVCVCFGDLRGQAKGVLLYRGVSSVPYLR